MKKYILCIDLDDTLYKELTYVKSGFNHVANFIESKTKASRNEIFKALMHDLYVNGRGRNFNNILNMYNLNTKNNVDKCLQIYRQHRPNIKLYSNVENFLKNFTESMYLITDGNTLVQRKKVDSLDINKYFQKIFYTRNYGIKSEKPSLNCFKKVADLEGTTLKHLCYIGDNPNKDFIGLKKHKGLTIQVGNKEYQSLDKSFHAEMKFDTFVNAVNYLKKNKII